MRKPGIEITITVLVVFMVVAIAMSGFMVYKSLSHIVNSIYDEAIPDYRLVVIKDINLDLLEIENNIQLYTLTNDKKNIKNYDTISNRLKTRVEVLSGLKNEQIGTINLNDSVKHLVETKLEILDELKKIYSVTINPREQFDTLYSQLEKTKVDTIQVEVEVAPPPKKGLLKKIFGKKDTVVTRIDTTFVEKTVVDEDVKDEIQHLETEIKQNERKSNMRELELIEQSIQVTAKLNELIARIEKAEKDGLIEKTIEADRLASLIYRRLAAFSILSVVLLFVVLFLFVRYLKRANTYQRVLTAAKLEAERLSNAKQVFMANVSHEMRTPVNAIYGLSEQLIQQKTNPKAKEQLKILLQSAKHLKTVVNDTLDFSKIQANKLKLEFVNFSPLSVLNEIMNLHKAEAKVKNVDLICRGKNNLPLALQGDPFRLKQILINIIGNALKFTEKGSITLKVKSKENNKDQLVLQFQIEDTGIGISKENLKTIFEDFVQVESDYTRKFSGTGLGLSIVKKLIELQDGNISIESDLNNGTVVNFQIPYKLGNPDAIEKLEHEQTIVDDAFKSLNFLGVDDEEFNRYVLKVIFEKWGVDYQIASNGEEAVNMALENNFDLILMDVRMPKLNGIDASKRIKNKKPKSNIIAVTALNSESEIKLCTEAGMDKFISKPFSEIDLYNTIQSVLEMVGESKISSDEFGLQELERLANGDQVFLKELIQIFIRSTQTGIQNIKNALKEENWEDISEAAHKMAAPCKHIMANDLYRKIKQLERFALEVESLPRVPGLVTSIESKIDKINKHFSTLIETGQFD